MAHRSRHLDSQQVDESVRSLRFCLLCGRFELKGDSGKGVPTGISRVLGFDDVDEVVLFKACLFCKVYPFVLGQSGSRKQVAELAWRLSRCLQATGAVFDDVESLTQCGNAYEVLKAQGRVDWFLEEPDGLDEEVDLRKEKNVRDIEIPEFWMDRVERMFGVEFLFFGNDRCDEDDGATVVSVRRKSEEVEDCEWLTRSVGTCSRRIRHLGD